MSNRFNQRGHHQIVESTVLRESEGRDVAGCGAGQLILEIVPVSQKEVRVSNDFRFGITPG